MDTLAKLDGNIVTDIQAVIQYVLLAIAAIASLINTIKGRKVQ